MAEPEPNLGPDLTIVKVDYEPGTPRSWPSVPLDGGIQSRPSRRWIAT